MAKTLLGALALAALPSALAFRNTSPFFLFSTAELLIDGTDASIAESSKVTTDVLGALKDCPTRSYIIVQQEGVSSADYADGRITPHLSQYMGGKHEEVKTTFALPDVVGQVDAAAILAHLQAKCTPNNDDQKAAAWFSRIMSKAPATSKALRTQQLLSEDAELEEQIVNEVKSRDYTVIYITTPQTETQAKAQLADEQYKYDMENSFGEAVQMELKRDLSSHMKRANSTQGGLFERYQYFTPGLFMGFAAIIPLFLILLVGIRALTSLEVSYYAFSKEMGPNAQKKQ
ncbi:BIG1-domain-containing protein [Cucurbitaria berberidis CBS 394.84]|uniref:Protein BIG1 n=1 Tax=Cucurbitaria berberidis CBS 394.84 TaxID=1168544 RepID=A0A9P4GGK1_9PLEO|nr:BIG1-domain-containing protein [Cucurbitaria berberidis CBS 394.84]KAF1845698.1 BIG1-domain-containing protein [Cucurbitaria berberidis CBS 394.84]